MNDDVTFSLLLPTRGRVPLVYRLLESLVSTTRNLSAIEVVLCIDDDDSASQQIAYPAIKLVKQVWPRDTMGILNNRCYQASRGRYLMIANDDIVFRTPNWDDLVLYSFAQFVDDIALVYADDLFGGKRLAALPFVSRKYCELADGICPNQYLRFYIDNHIFDVFKRLSYRGFDRIIYLENVIIEHLHVLAGKAPVDDTYSNYDSNIDFEIYQQLVPERKALVETILGYCQTGNFPQSVQTRVEQHPAHLYYQATLLNAQKDFTSAQEKLSAALTKTKEGILHAHIIYNLWKIMQQEDNPARADEFLKAHGLDDTYLMMGKYLVELKELVSAREIFQMGASFISDETKRMIALRAGASITNLINKHSSANNYREIIINQEHAPSLQRS